MVSLTGSEFVKIILHIVCLWLFCRCRSNYQGGVGWGGGLLIPPHFLPRIPLAYVVVRFVFIDLRCK